MLAAFLMLSLSQEPIVKGVIVDDKYVVTIDGEPFATVNYKDVARPFIYPLYAPGGVQILRNFPMVEGVEGEEKDHPHHTGVWFAHGDISGSDTWLSKGKIEMIGSPQSSGKSVLLEGNLLREDGSLVGRCDQRYTFRVLSDGSRAIDFWIHLVPQKGTALKFGDTKEGTFGFRTHPNLRLERSDGGPTGHVLNSEGVSDKSVWGKRAKWIDYWGVVDGKTIGIALMDNPVNPRFPTWWHAREYGLVAANPFGVSYFESKPAGTGEMELKLDEPVMFKYRIVLHKGSAQDAKIGELYRNWANGEQDD